MKKSPEIVAIKNFTIPYEAHLAKAELEANGIEAFVQDQHLASINLWYSQAIGGVKLFVNRSDAKLALEILEKEVAYDLYQCPKCSGTDIINLKEANWKKRGFFSLLIFSIFGYPWIFSNCYRCSDCGYEGKRFDFDIDEPFEEDN